MTTTVGPLLKPGSTNSRPPAGNELGGSARAWAWPIVLLAIGLTLRLVLSWKDHRVLLAEYLWYDDSYLALTIARNLALGLGMTSDGLHVTNGFQPLYVFLLVPFLALLSPENLVLPIHIAATLLSLSGTAAAGMFYLIARRLYSRTAALCVLFMFMVSNYFVNMDMNGMETAVYGLTLAGTLYYYVRHFTTEIPPTLGRCLILGLLSGLATLARVDAVIFLAFMAWDFAWRNRGLGRPLLARLFAGGVTFLLTLSPWLVASYLTCGTVFQISGPAVRFISARMGFRVVGNYVGYTGAESFRPEDAPWQYYANNLLHMTAQGVAMYPPTAHTQGFEPSYVALFSIRFKTGQFLARYPWLGLGLLGAVMVAGIAGPWLFSRGRQKEEPGLKPILFTRFAMIAWLLAYACFVFGPWHTYRYLYPVLALLTLMSGRPIDALLGLIGPRRRGLQRAVLAGGAAAYGFCFWTQAGHHFTAQVGRVPPDPYSPIIPWLKKHLPPDARLGAFQSGILSYFLPMTCVNLDGVVNADAYEALRADRVWDYLAETGVEYLVEWPVNVERFLPVSERPDGARLDTLYDDEEMVVYRVTHGPGVQR